MALEYICGDDAYLIEHSAKAAFERLSLGLDATFDCSIISGEAHTVGEVERCVYQAIQAIATLSLFGKRLVWLRGVSFLGDSVTATAKGTVAALENLEAALQSCDNATVDVLISAYPVDRRRTFSKFLEKQADHCVRLSFKNEAQVQEWVLEQARTRGLELTADQAFFLVNVVGMDAGALSSEIEKISTYLGPDQKTLKPELFKNLVTGLGEGDFFEFVESFYSEAADPVLKSLNALDRYFFHNKESRPLLFALQNRNRLLIQLKALKDAGALPSLSKEALDAAQLTYGADAPALLEKTSSNLFSQNPWYLSKLAHCLPRFTLKQLLDVQLYLVEAFEGILQKPHEQREVLRRFVAQCFCG